MDCDDCDDGFKRVPFGDDPFDNDDFGRRDGGYGAMDQNRSHPHGGGNRERCMRCHGRGWRHCRRCRHDVVYDSGMSFLGLELEIDVEKSTGEVDCETCRRSGRVQCSQCTGFGTVMHFKRLTCTFKIQRSEDVVAYSQGLDENVVKTSQGMQLLSFEAPAIGPIQNFKERRVNDLSRGLLDQHRRYHTGNTRILRQKHELTAVPIHEVHCGEWQFWIIGDPPVVVVDDYPSTCACCVVC